MEYHFKQLTQSKTKSVQSYTDPLDLSLRRMNESDFFLQSGFAVTKIFKSLNSVLNSNPYEK